MSSIVRSMQRDIIRQRCYKRDGNTKAFHKEWEKFHNPRVEVANTDGTVTSKIKRTQKKKQRHNDNGKLFVKQLKAFKGFIDNLKNGAAKKRKELETEKNPVTE